VMADEENSGVGRTGKKEHTCEVCRTLGDVLRRLEPEKYRSGAVLEVGEAIEQALDAHAARESAWPNPMRGEARAGS